MKKRWILWGLAGLLALSVLLAGAAGSGLLGWLTGVPVSAGMPVPGHGDVPETIVGTQMPVPGSQGVEEAIVGSQMPVPGLEGVEEMIVNGE